MLGLQAGKTRGEVVPPGEATSIVDPAPRDQERSKENVNFNAYDPDALELLPPWIQEQLPFRATRRGAVDKTLLEFLTLLFVSVGSVAGVRARLAELAHIGFCRDMLLYYEVAAHLFHLDVRGGRGGPSKQTKINNFFTYRAQVPGATDETRALHAPITEVRQPATFGSPEDRSYGPPAVYVPSPQYLINVFLAVHDEEKDYEERYMAQLGAKILKTDHTFKAAKRIRGKNGERLFEAVLTVMNEHSQPIAQWFTQDKSLANMEDELKKLSERFQSEHVQVCHRNVFET